MSTSTLLPTDKTPLADRSAVPKVPAAMYLRRSTDQQEYSLEGQAALIREYADLHNFEIIATYKDEGKSGVTLKHRLGIQRLLHDALSGPPFKAILVWDVSRWGRFQDVDEAAHYEFLCRNAGIPIHYCGDHFSDSNTLSEALLKTLKRAMAADYSRQLGEKVLAGQRRLAALGFSAGGRPPYAFQRLLVDREGKTRQILATGERKRVATDRVRFTPGPDEEVMAVRAVFELALTHGNNSKTIAGELDRQGIKYRGQSWTPMRVASIIRDPRYTGTLVWGRNTTRLQASPRRARKNEWVVAPGKLPAIIDQATFDRVSPRRWNDETILDFLRELHHKEGHVNIRLITMNGGPCYVTIKHHFGSMSNALELIGTPFRRQRTHNARRPFATQLAQELHSMFPDRVELFSAGPHYKWRLLVDRQYKVDILLMAQNFTTHRPAWSLTLRTLPQPQFALFCLMGDGDEEIHKKYVKRWRDGAIAIHLTEKSTWFKDAVEVKHLSEFYECLKRAIRAAG